MWTWTLAKAERTGLTVCADEGQSWISDLDLEQNSQSGFELEILPRYFLKYEVQNANGWSVCSFWCPVGMKDNSAIPEVYNDPLTYDS